MNRMANYISKNLNSSLNKMACCLAVLLLTNSGVAYSYRNHNNLGAKAMGMGGAFIAVADDPTTIYWNPAGLTQSEEMKIAIAGEISNGEGYFLGKFLYETSHYFPSFIGITSKTGNLFWGVAEYIPYDYYARIKDLEGTTIENPESEGKYDLIDVTRFYTTALSFAYKITKNISIGLNTNYLLQRRWFTYEYKEKEDEKFLIQKANGIGGTVGIIYTINEKFNLGITLNGGYIKGERPGMKPDTSEEGWPQDLPLYSSDMPIEETLPLFVALSIAINTSPQSLLSCDLNFTQWSKVKSKVGEDLEDIDFRDVFQFRTGFEYHLKENLDLRTGLYIDPSPFQTRFDQVFLTGGIGYRFRYFNFDLALMDSRLILSEDEKETVLILSIVYERK